MTWTKRRMVRLVVAFMMCGTAAACGKKTMPTAPRTQSPPPVTDLSCQPQNGDVLLRWHLPEAVRNRSLGNGQMVLSRARSRLADPLCPGCPMVFQRIARIPFDAVDPEGGATYSETLIAGFRYYYKVELVMDNGRTSADSNIVQAERAAGAFPPSR